MVEAVPIVMQCPVERLMQLSDRISRTYFSHTPIARAFGVGE